MNCQSIISFFRVSTAVVLSILPGCAVSPRVVVEDATLNAVDVDVISAQDINTLEGDVNLRGGYTCDEILRSLNCHAFGWLQFATRLNGTPCNVPYNFCEAFGRRDPSYGRDVICYCDGAAGESVWRCTVLSDCFEDAGVDVPSRPLPRDAERGE